jgi:hypothetical protein
MWALHSLMVRRCRAHFTYLFCDTDCNQFTLGVYHSSLTIVATTVLVLIATLLLTLFSNVPVWRGLDYNITLWQHSAEAWVCAWPSSSVLLPTRNWLRASCIPHTHTHTHTHAHTHTRTHAHIYLNDVTGVKTWGRQTLWQAWCLSPSRLHSPMSHVNYRLFFKHSDPSFQWLLAAHIEKFLELLLPVCYTFCHACCSWQSCTVL